MPESETDLVGGFHTEYGSFKFGIFFVAEYAHIVIGSAIFTLTFPRGWNFLPWVENPWPANWIGTLHRNWLVFGQNNWTYILFHLDSLDTSKISIRPGDASRLD